MQNDQEITTDREKKKILQNHLTTNTHTNTHNKPQFNQTHKTQKKQTNKHKKQTKTTQF